MNHEPPQSETLQACPSVRNLASLSLGPKPCKLVPRSIRGRASLSLSPKPCKLVSQSETLQACLSVRDLASLFSALTLASARCGGIKDLLRFSSEFDECSEVTACHLCLHGKHSHPLDKCQCQPGFHWNALPPLPCHHPGNNRQGLRLMLLIVPFQSRRA